MDEYLDVLEGFRLNLQAANTRLEEIDSVSNVLVTEIATKSSLLTENVRSLNLHDRQEHLVNLREEYGRLLQYLDEKVVTVARVLLDADKTTTELDVTLSNLEEEYAESTTDGIEPSGFTSTSSYIPHGAGTTGAKPGSAPGAVRQRSPNKPSTVPADGRVTVHAGPGSSSSSSSANVTSSGGQAAKAAPAAAAVVAAAAVAAQPATAAAITKRRPQGAEAAASPPSASQIARKRQRNNPLAALESLPIYKGKGPFPPLCGPNPAPPDYVMQKGDAVAARTSKPKDVEQEWILAMVVRFLGGRQRYEVEDVEDDETDGKQPGTKKKYILPADAIIPLPKTLPDPTKTLEFGAGRKVLALYPGTTCFYEAEVIQPPSKRRKENNYLVQFADDEESEMPQKAIAQAFVLNMPANGSGSA